MTSDAARRIEHRLKRQRALEEKNKADIVDGKKVESLLSNNESKSTPTFGVKSAEASSATPKISFGVSNNSAGEKKTTTDKQTTTPAVSFGIGFNNNHEKWLN